MTKYDHRATTIRFDLTKTKKIKFCVLLKVLYCNYSNIQNRKFLSLKDKGIRLGNSLSWEKGKGKREKGNSFSCKFD